MAKPKRTTGNSKKKAIEQYDHKGKLRTNNPPVGLVNPATDKESGKKSYAYDPHLDPQLVGKAERTSFEVPIAVYKGVVHKYRPDFIIRLKTGNFLVLETKGQDSDQDKAKRKFLDEWVNAVNEHAEFGKWSLRWRESREMLSGYSENILLGRFSMSSGHRFEGNHFDRDFWKS